MKILISFLASLLLAACQAPVTVSPSSEPVRNANASSEPNLSQESAELRSRLISKVAYDLTLDLDEKSPEYRGQVTIDFTLSGVDGRLALDFKRGGKVTSIVVNENAVSLDAYQGGRIQIPVTTQVRGANRVVIDYSHKYSSDSTGFYRFQDPEDQRVYLWTTFEPFDANHLLPCFDQPDLKAKLKLKVGAPATWELISTAREVAKLETNGRRQWVFPETAPISTYLYSLHAGPYQVWTSSAGTIPLRLFARRSLAKFVDAEIWFSITRAGLKFYNEYFDYPYPFKKYDQVIAPDASGAMENVAAVTFGEDYVTRSQMTRQERSELAEVILHEMAHMWFGDLVTMQWWNGLWLNESFASYMASMAASQATEFKDSWVGFHSSMKTWAYWEDQQVTTHPIDGRIVDTNSASASFDGVTYGKGASALQQLAFFIGPEKFRNGMRAYFKSYEFRNTRLEDFISSLAEASGRDLVPWSRQWLLSSGVDTARAEYKCAGGRISSFEVQLQAPELEARDVGGHVRPHRTRIGLYSLSGSALKRVSTVDVELNAPVNAVPDLVGRPCPNLVLVNDEDLDYLKVRFDERSLAVVRDHLAKLSDPLARLLVWTNLYEMLRDGKLPPQDYLDIAERAIRTETSDRVLEQLFRTLTISSSRSSAFSYLPVSSKEDLASSLKIASRIETLLWSKVQASRSKPEWMKTYFEGLVRVTQTRSGAKRLAKLLNPKNKSRGFDQDRRWQIVVRVNAIDAELGKPLLAQEKLRDSSERGEQMALAAEAAAPSLEVKREWFRKLSESELTGARKVTIMRSFLPLWQAPLRKELSADFYKVLLARTTTVDQETNERYAGYLVPTTCDRESSRQLNEFIVANLATLQPAVLKQLRQALQENLRCARLRDLASAARRPEKVK